MLNLITFIAYAKGVYRWLFTTRGRISRD